MGFLTIGMLFGWITVIMGENYVPQRFVMFFINTKPYLMVENSLRAPELLCTQKPSSSGSEASHKAKYDWNRQSWLSAKLETRWDLDFFVCKPSNNLNQYVLELGFLRIWSIPCRFGSIMCKPASHFDADFWCELAGSPWEFDWFRAKNWWNPD